MPSALGTDSLLKVTGFCFPGHDSGDPAWAQRRSPAPHLCSSHEIRRGNPAGWCSGAHLLDLETSLPSPAAHCREHWGYRSPEALQFGAEPGSFSWEAGSGLGVYERTETSVPRFPCA